MEGGPWGRDTASTYMQVKVKENGKRVALASCDPVQRNFKVLHLVFGKRYTSNIDVMHTLKWHTRGFHIPGKGLGGGFLWLWILRRSEVTSYPRETVILWRLQPGLQ